MTEEARGDRTVRVGNWIVSPATGRLQRGSEVAKLEPRAMAVLAYLAARPGVLVSRDELERALWSGTVVGYKALTNTIIKLRKALRDDARQPHYIETISKRGYRLIAEVVELPQRAQSSPFHQSVGAAGTSARPRGKPGIAVLPFSDLSGERQDTYFCDGMTDDLITELSRFPLVYVIARQSSFAFRDLAAPLQEVGDRLGVDYVVQGSIRLAGNRVRISAQLLDVASQRQLWADRYDRDLGDIFAIQDQVTRAMVATLTGRLETSAAQRASRKPPEDIQAYDYLLRGIDSARRFTAADIANARNFFEQAIAQDADFARAHACLAQTYNAQSLMGWETVAPGRGLDPARRAVQLDNTDYHCRLALAWALFDLARWDEAEAEFDRVLALRPGDAEVLVYVGNALTSLGRCEEGLELIEEAMRLNPLHPESYRRFHGLALYDLGRYADAVEALGGDHLREAWGYAYLAAAYVELGKLEQARNALDSFVALRSEELAAAGVTAHDTPTLLGRYRKNFPKARQWDQFIGSLHKAGLPE